MSYTPHIDDTPGGRYIPHIDDTPEENSPAVNKILKNVSDQKEDTTSPYKMTDNIFGHVEDLRDKNNPNSPYHIPTKENFNQAAGTILPILAPEGKLASLLPKSLINKLPELSPSMKIMRDYLGNVGKVGGATYLGSSIMPGSTHDMNVEAGQKGAAWAAGLTPLAIAAASKNPYARLFGGGALGFGAGYGIAGSDHPILEGLSALAGGMGALRGKGGSELAAHNIASTITPEQRQMAMQRQAAGNAEGVPLSLAEASGSPALGKMQQEAAINKEGAKVLFPWAQNREQAEQDSYNNLLNKISPKTAQKDIIGPLYANAASDTIPVKDMQQLLNEPTIKEAFDSVQANPYYARKLKDAPLNSVKYLDQVKKNLDDIVNSSNKKGEEHLASLQNEDPKALTKIMDKNSQSYKAARQAASMNFNRAYIENAMSNSNISGSNFYNNVLKNPNNYDELYNKLKDPTRPNVQTSAQKSLSNMRIAFPDLIDNLTAKSGASLAEKNPGLSFNPNDLMKSLLNKTYMDNYQSSIAKLMIDPKWHEELDNVAKIKSSEDRGIRLGRLISKVAATEGMAAQQNKHGSNQYGTGQ